MIELTLTPDAERYGRGVKKRYDRRGVTDAFNKNGSDKRWTGHAVEYELHQWLDGQGIPHRWNWDGLGNKPDFVLGHEDGIRVAIKANSGDSPRPDFIFMVPEHHVHKLGDGALFAIVGVRHRTIWVAGYIDARHFRRYSEKLRAGDEGFVHGRPIECDCRTIRLADLEPADRFFDLLRATCA